MQSSTAVGALTGMNEQVDIAVDLGVVAPPLPEIMNLRELVEAAV